MSKPYMTIEINLGIVNQILKDYFTEKHNLSMGEYSIRSQWKFTQQDRGQVECSHGFSTPVILRVEKLRR